uniref:Uncharacterized protein n=1 Tax=Eucampia antarctica TaxID=49252 RepID=A0A7S2WN31_9STRA|mmetsp:Transcript_6382/g.5984  ORF Transcript_6382/g.5984 Transcript_6382/m.5984 type:complete len:111 (+) Transcript_6382:127-459(+)|eukprot:CAMPEP_0197835466 /NCGR_PEP_ID=MMETSP1437-20131217/25823_1 /TAXON_ID=49252 ORGANISM="Eucampia antarctica, Strain CCMP1452" /NCGR_SAMPLE_ID=MMETSP1437 /ASSEMBLY_ACC=CAM_ASM_001096 /LENGTH=110 /DNA_ID=CAMNT_0043440923 /DNA_START=120 /DNA_END=452 /DNA_ORIENTATION=-
MTKDLKPGQKYPTPTPGFGDRVFYETLFRQRPESHMAQEWCLNYGVLHLDEAAKLYKKVLKRKGKSFNVVPTSKKSTSPTKKRKPKILHDEGADIDMQVGGDQGIGTSAL